MPRLHEVLALGRLQRCPLLTPPPPIRPQSLSCSLALDRLLRPSWALEGQAEC